MHWHENQINYWESGQAYNDWHNNSNTNYAGITYNIIDDRGELCSFIDSFNKEHIKNLNKNIAIIFRNYTKSLDLNQIVTIKEFCKLTKRKFLISNIVKLALKLNLDGVYLPSFNKSYKINNLC